MIGRAIRLTLLPTGIALVFVIWGLAPLSGNGQVKTPPPPMPKNLTVAGNITSLTVGAGGVGTVVITPNNGAAVTLNVTGNTAIFIDKAGGKVINNLSTLMQAEATYQANGTAVRIDASATYQVVGTITSVIPGAIPASGTIGISGGGGGQSVALNVGGAQTSITLGGVAKFFGDLQPGMKAEATYQITGPGAGNALKIVVAPSNLVIGTLTAIDPVAGTITITTNSGFSFTMGVSPNTSLLIDRVANQTVANLILGMRIEAAISFPPNGPAVARKIEATERNTVHGFISAVNVGNGTLAITPANGPAITVSTVNATIATIDKVAVQNLNNVLVGMKADVQFVATGLGTGVASKIDLIDRYTMIGTLSTVSPDANGVTGTVVITAAKTPPLNLTVTPTTTITVNGVSRRTTIANLSIGMRAEAAVQITPTGNFISTLTTK
jgi:hypothetical protein